ncbi:MAG: hypothetical protein ACK4S4_13455 [Pyrinomonadaceae bacterium]
MREAFFVLLVIVVLLGLTAFRYRRQIAGMIRLYRVIKGQARAAAEARSLEREPDASELVNCSRCGRWVPANEAVRMKGGMALCAKDCTRSSRTASQRR